MTLGEPVSVYRKISTNDDNATIVLAQAAFVTGAMLFNTNAAVRYLKLYNKVTAPASTDTPVLTVIVPGSAVAPQPLVFPMVPFNAGLGIRITTGLADNDTGAPGASEVIVHVFYRGQPT